MKLKNIAFGIVSIFALFGMLMGMNIIHELSHRQDLRDVVVNGEICALVIPDSLSPKEIIENPIALYSYEYNPSADKEKYDKIGKYTEYKAYFLGTLVAILFFSSFFYFLFHVKKA